MQNEIVYAQQLADAQVNACYYLVLLLCDLGEYISPENMQ